MRYNPKFIKEYAIQGYYYGIWEDETTDATLREARAQIKCYKENVPHIPYRIKGRKVENPDYIPDAITKTTAEKQFKAEFLPSLDKTDKPLLRFEWNCFVDMLQKSRQISQEQAANWTQPKFCA